MIQLIFRGPLHFLSGLIGASKLTH